MLKPCRRMTVNPYRITVSDILGSLAFFGILAAMVVAGLAG